MALKLSKDRVTKKDGWGWVRECSNPSNCGRCRLKKRCKVEKKVWVNAYILQHEIMGRCLVVQEGTGSAYYPIHELRANLWLATAYEKEGKTISQIFLMENGR